MVGVDFVNSLEGISNCIAQIKFQFGKIKKMNKVEHKKPILVIPNQLNTNNKKCSNTFKR